MKTDGSNNIRIGLDTLTGSRQSDWAADKIVHIRFYSEPEICIMDPDGLNVNRITFSNSLKDSPKLTLNGSTIVFFVQNSGPTFQVWSINTNGTNLRQLTSSQGYSPNWSPDGETIVFTDSSPNNGKLWKMSKDGVNKIQLTH